MEPFPIPPSPNDGPPNLQRLNWLKPRRSDLEIAWYVCCLLDVMCLPLLVLTTQFSSSASEVVGLILAIYIAMCFFILPWTYFLIRSRGLKLVLEENLEVCVKCRYSLRRLPFKGICPECGTPYDKQSDAISWRSVYRYRGALQQTGDGRP